MDGIVGGKVLGRLFVPVLFAVERMLLVDRTDGAESAGATPLMVTRPRLGVCGLRLCRIDHQGRELLGQGPVDQPG